MFALINLLSNSKLIKDLELNNKIYKAGSKIQKEDLENINKFLLLSLVR